MDTLNRTYEQNRYQDELFPFVTFDIKKGRPLSGGRGFDDLHWHTDLQFTLVLKGNVVMQVNGEDFSLGEGEAIFLNRNVLHMTQSRTEKDHYITFNFPEKLLGLFPGSRIALKYLAPYTSNLNLPAVVLRRQTWHTEGISILYRLMELTETEQFLGWEMEVICHLMRLWTLLVENTPLPDCPSQSRLQLSQERMQLLLTYVHRNYGQSIRLEDIAAAANISVSECTRCFKKTVHTTPYEYLIQYRLKKAEELLINSTFSVTEVSLMCGFNHVNHFIQTFKRRHGVTPRAYRKKVLEGQS